jgi:hypothetical protein
VCNRWYKDYKGEIMAELTRHLDKASESLERWYWQAGEFLRLSAYFKKYWMFSDARGCKQQALKCKTLGIVFHDRYKLVLDVK